MLTIKEHRFGRPLTLVLGASGMTGRRVAQRLWDGGHPIRVGSRFAEPAFDWRNRATWRPALHGVRAVYLSFHPDVAAPAAEVTVRAFVGAAMDSGVRRIVLLSRRGHAGARRCEQAVTGSGADWTILRCSWLSQAFSEGWLVDGVLRGTVSLPVGQAPEPFVDADDVAEVAFEALTGPGHSGRTYELTGARGLSFEEAVGAIAVAAGRAIRFERVSRDRFKTLAARYRMPVERACLVAQLLEAVSNGANAGLAGDLRRVTGRAPRTFEAYTRSAFAGGSRRQRPARARAMA
jgi:uncharacterized protein YbjT (DUF2867 family)